MLNTIQSLPVPTQRIYLTEVSMISNITEHERMPRDNDGTREEEFETLECPYQRLKAHYGSW